MTVFMTASGAGGMYGSLRRDRFDRSWSAYAGRFADAPNPWHESFDAPYATARALWPSGSCLMQGDGASGWSGDAATGFSGDWSPWVGVTKGSNSLKYVLGQAKDSGGTGVSGATIKLFRTSTDELVSTVGSDAQGYYAAPTPYSGESHYSVATGTGIAGVTVNTLIPTNMDGT